MDFHVGSVTREHADIDLAVWAHDADDLAAVLREGGWRHAPEPDEDGGTGYTRDGVRVELTYLVRDDAGHILIPLRSGSVLWSELPLGDEVGELHGVRARLVPVALLRAGKSSPRADPADAARDQADFDALSRLDA